MSVQSRDGCCGKWSKLCLNVVHPKSRGDDTRMTKHPGFDLLASTLHPLESFKQRGINTQYFILVEVL